MNAHQRRTKRRRTWAFDIEIGPGFVWAEGQRCGGVMALHPGQDPKQAAKALAELAETWHKAARTGPWLDYNPPVLMFSLPSPTGLNIAQPDVQPWPGRTVGLSQNFQAPFNTNFSELEMRVDAWAGRGYADARICDVFGVGVTSLQISLSARTEWLRRVRKAYGLPDAQLDLHTLLACRLFGAAYDEVTPAQRAEGKRQNYMRMYTPAYNSTTQHPGEQE